MLLTKPPGDMNKMLAYAAMLSLTMEWGVVATRRDDLPDFSQEIIAAVESAVRIMNMDAVGTEQAAAIMQVSSLNLCACSTN
jgi:hypothetical protein